MEAVPKLPMLSFELKTSPESTHFGPQLKQYISEAYREDPDSYSNEMHQLESLRSAAVRPTIDAAGLNAMIRYFCQLRAMQSRFPMAKDQPVACTYAWKDLYANMSCSLADIRFEMSCILYNIGALHTQLGASEPRTSADSLKSACTHFQTAAWAFQYLREHYPQPPGVDVSTDIMRFLQEICFAQAQECILEKSIQDTRKSSVIGAVAAQVSAFYKNSLALLGPSSGSDNIHEIIGTKLYNYWHRNLSFKSFYIGCLVCLYQGMNAEEQQKMGERVAFYQQAAEKLSEARKLAKYVEPIQVTQEALTFTNDVVEGKRKAAKNENEFIYHEEVPDKDLLSDLKPVCLVKALPINFNDPEVSGPDIFSRLVPMGAHEASSVYSEEKAKLLRQVVGQAEIKNTELTEFMSSLQLDQLEVLDSDQKVPQEIVDRCAAMNAKTEIIQSLVDSMNGLAEIISDVEHSLAEIKNLIQEETLKEKEYQKAMGPRPPSLVQTELSREFHKYQEAHSRTNESNQVLHKAMTLHIANLKILAQPLEVLQSKIPSIDNIEDLDRETMIEMRRVVAKAHEMQTQRNALIQELRDAVTSDDITSQLLARYSEPAQEIFKEELEKHTPKIKIIEQNLAAQENIINKLTSLYAAYGDSRRLLSEVLRKRDGLISALITSYDTYTELLGKSHKGLEFYKKLSHNVNQLLARVRSTCRVQDEERDGLMCKQSEKREEITPAPAVVKPKETPSNVTPSSTPKLKDYLPYMNIKGRRARTTPPPQAQMEQLPSDGYYPESIYPTSIRPAPVGSEDITQATLPDGVVPAMQNATFGGYPTTYQNETDPYANQPIYAYPHKDHYEKPPENYYNTPYTPSQFSSQMPDQQTYSNPYYSTQTSATHITDSQSPIYNMGQTNNNPNAQQYSVYDSYAAQTSQIPEATNPVDISKSFRQMQIEKSEPSYSTEYAQTYYSVQYPQTATPNNMATYSNAPQNSNTNMTSSQVPADYNTLNYPYSSETGIQFTQTNPVVSKSYADSQYNYASTSYDPMSQLQGTVIYTNTDSAFTSTTTLNNVSVNESKENDPHYVDPAVLSQLAAYDKPIKSHVTGEALSDLPTYQPYATVQYTTQTDQNIASSYSNPPEQQPSNQMQYTNQTQNVNYAQVYQNHPGYNYNSATGDYDYNYGSQTSYSSFDNSMQSNLNSQPTDTVSNWPAQVYTSAGSYDTIQSPSEIPHNVSELPVEQNNQNYYNVPYGYVTTAQNDSASNSQPEVTNYGANMNQSTYMQSGHEQDTSVSYTNNQASSPTENVHAPNFQQNTVPMVQNETVQEPQVETQEVQVIPIAEEKPEPTTFDLLSDIDFTLDQPPLTPQIKVPQISESAIKKSTIHLPKEEPVVAPKVEKIIKFEKVDIFSDPSLMNKFTQEAKALQICVDSFTNKTASGLTVLDSKWKALQELQAKENSSRSRSIAMKHATGGITRHVVPYDDSRLTLKWEPDGYLNASYYTQLLPGCIPLVISNNPSTEEYRTFWKAIVEYKTSCIACLMSEIEVRMQGSCYWPLAIGQRIDFSGIQVTLNQVSTSVYWTERNLTVTSDKHVHNVTHYQINVFPTKFSAPLLQLAHKLISGTQDNSGLCWIQCNSGSGLSATVALLVACVCSIVIGRTNVCQLLEEGCINLYKRRTNVLEDTKYLAEAYRASLFYVQGVMCSGTTMFNGETITPSGAAILPPTPVPTNHRQKFTRESFEEMKQSPGLKTGDMKDPLNFLDPLWSLKKK